MGGGADRTGSNPPPAPALIPPGVDHMEVEGAERTGVDAAKADFSQWKLRAQLEHPRPGDLLELESVDISEADLEHHPSRVVSRL